MKFSHFGFRPRVAVVCLLLLFVRPLESDTRPPAEDIGATHLYQLLLKLHTTGRILHTVAHPDDEDGGLLTLESRGRGVTAQLFTLNRGEGGQNKFGTETAEDLGILRTLELLEADKYYGVEQRFSHVVDFGFSKTAEETFEKWQGHDIALADMVYAIRVFKPDVLISRFSGTRRDGHGHHEAAGILTQEAFRAAADPNRFPEQIQAGLLPWQAKKLYSDNVPRGFSFNPAEEDYTINLDTGEYSPFLGMSYAQFALEGLAHQTSQGTGGARISPGHRPDYYKLLDSVLPSKPTHEKDFFEGIDTSLPGLASRLGDREKVVPFLRLALISLAKHVEEATKAFSMHDPTACAAPLLAGVKETSDLIQRVDGSGLSPAEKALLLPSLRDKVSQFEQAANEAMGIYFSFYVDPAGPPAEPSYFPRLEQTFSLAVPGTKFTATAHLYNRGKVPIEQANIQAMAPAGWSVSVLKPAADKVNPGEMTSTQFEIGVPADAPYTRPYWSRKDAQDTIYTVHDPKLLTLPLPPYPLSARATFSTANGGSETHKVAKVRFVDPTSGQSERPLAVGPALSVLLESPVIVLSTAGSAGAEINVSVRSNLQQAVHARLHLQAPTGWKVEPESIAVDFDHDGDVNNYSFHIMPHDLHEGRYDVTARAEYNGKEYAEGFKIVTRPDLDSFYSYHPATQNVQAVDVKPVPPGLKVGYIMGAGDEIPTVLAGLGVNVTLITPQELAGGDLSRYNTIVVGIRAYDVRTDVREQNRRLLDYVNRGGTLIVQYNQSVGIFNDGHYTPYPATLSSARVSVEEMPVDILDPNNPVFSYPNKIEAKDFDHWVQERGLYFMGKWDEHFQPLLSSHDPGESPQNGGLLMAHYGKGIYIYSGYAFFRQLPAGVPGAIRLFVNLLSSK